MQGVSNVELAPFGLLSVDMNAAANDDNDQNWESSPDSLFHHRRFSLPAWKFKHTPKNGSLTSQGQSEEQPAVGNMYVLINITIH